MKAKLLAPTLLLTFFAAPTAENWAPGDVPFINTWLVLGTFHNREALGVKAVAPLWETMPNTKVEDRGLEPVSSESQWEKLQQLTSAPDPVAAYLQLLNDTHSHSLASPELELAYLLVRWPHLPDHIRQTIITLVRSVDSTTATPF